MLRRYICNKYKRYSIRNHYFEGGKFETSDPAVQKLIESADGYGVFIHPVETKEELAAMKKKEREERLAHQPQPPEPEPVLAHQGARNSMTSQQERGLCIVAARK